MRRTLVILAVGLASRHLAGPNTPQLSALARAGTVRPLRTVTPAVTCSVQATFMTGSLPRDHGIVGNGWYFRDLLEIWFWRQSNRLVAGEPIWAAGKRRNAAFTCANLFWWYNLGAAHDVGATPRPIYKADGRKVPDCYTTPAELRHELQARLGTFPLFQFWGPGASLPSSQWIAGAARHVLATRDPTLALIYLPHLDYDLQRYGPDESDARVAKALRDLDAVAGELAADASREGRRVIVLSEYGITAVDTPIPINQSLRRAGLLAIREEEGGELLDPIASQAFAVADHQIAHIYVREGCSIEPVRRLVQDLPGVEQVLDDRGKRAIGLDHARSGDLVAIARPDAWFCYYYWLDPGRAPDFARTVEIHRKPGYDPVELFFDPALRPLKIALGWRLLRRSFGFRTLMDVVPLDPSLVRGSHGRPTYGLDGPVIIGSEPGLLPEEVSAVDIKSIILDHVFGP